MLHDVVAKPGERASKCGQHVGGRGVIFLGVIENLLWRFLRIDFLCGIVEALLIGAQVRIADFEELIERDIDHFVIEKLLAVVLRAEFVIAVGAREKIGLQPVQPRLEFFDDDGIGLL